MLRVYKLAVVPQNFVGWVCCKICMRVFECLYLRVTCSQNTSVAKNQKRLVIIRVSLYLWGVLLAGDTKCDICGTKNLTVAISHSTLGYSIVEQKKIQTQQMEEIFNVYLILLFIHLKEQTDSGKCKFANFWSPYNWNAPILY